MHDNDDASWLTLKFLLDHLCRTRLGLTEHENYHEFCRLLGRLKSNYQLSELVGWQECLWDTHTCTE